jgi:hypothetical protein
MAGPFIESLRGNAEARPLAALRIGVAAVLLAQAFAFAPSLFLFFGEHGIVQAPIASVLVPSALPRVTWFLKLLGPYFDERTVLLGCFCLYVGALHLLLAGCQSRAAAIIAWLMHLSLKTTGTASAYGVFEFATIALFYCSVFPVGAALSIDASSSKRDDSFAAKLGLRVIQLHLCIVYLSSGIEKIRGEQWRNGEAMWRAVMRPRFAAFDLSWLAAHPTIPLLACWSTLVVELGYAVFIWPQRTRRAWALATIGLHLGIGIFLGLWSFAALMIVLNASAFLTGTRAARRAHANSAFKNPRLKAAATVLTPSTPTYM